MNSIKPADGVELQCERRAVTAGDDAATLQDGDKTTMFYDGGCPLCRREVGHYQQLDKAKRIRWIDIDTRPESLQTVGIEPVDAMRRLHVLTSEGEIVRGTHAFAVIWSELPYYRHISTLLRRLRALRLIEPFYELFAGWRFRRRLREGDCGAQQGRIVVKGRARR